MKGGAKSYSNIVILSERALAFKLKCWVLPPVR